MTANLAGAKSGAGDAKVLADLVRTDRHNHRPIAGDEAIKVLAKDTRSLIWAHTRHTNARLSIAQIRSALRRGGRQRNLDRRAEQIQAALRSEQLAAPAVVAEAYAATTAAAVGIITQLNAQIAALEKRLASDF